MNVQKWLHLRSETKPGEARTPLTPADANTLISSGLKLTVEKSIQRIFTDKEYLEAGAELAEPGAWESLPAGTFVLGLKELPDSDRPIAQTHCYFAHAFKGQAGARELLSRFERGGGRLMDLEYLTDPQGKRLVAFGKWAGFVGAAVGVLHLAPKTSSPLIPWPNRRALIQAARQALLSNSDSSFRKPRALVTGAKGRCGQGALELLRTIGMDTTAWDLEETKAGGPFNEILDFDLLVHCASSNRPVGDRPLIDSGQLRIPGHRLRTIVDVSCDLGNPTNLLAFDYPLTNLSSPTVRVAHTTVIAIDHLPTLLPKESSDEFSAGLLPLLTSYFSLTHNPWQKTFAKFVEALA